MSQLENKVASSILAMMRGRAIELSTTQQLNLSIWALKTAMVFDSAWDEGPHYFTQQEREQLARSMKGGLEPPSLVHSQ